MASIASLDCLLLISFILQSYALLFVTSLFYAGKPNPASYAGLWESPHGEQL